MSGIANQMTNILSQVRAHWYWKANGNARQSDQNEEWIKYPDAESQIIEEAFQNKDKTNMIEFDHYWINFDEMIQINKYDENQPISIKRAIISGNAGEARLREFVMPSYRPEPFNESGLEGGISFIYDWSKRNAMLPNSEIVQRAADGIITEGNYSGKHEEGEKLARLLMKAQYNSESDILKCCLHLYSLEAFLYSLVNKTLRENDKTKVETLAPFCYFLTEAIWSDALAHERYKRLVYRGVSLDLSSIDEFKKAIGTYKCWYGFTSTSRSREISERFGNGLFIIDISRTGGLDISRFSDFPYEEEVILPPGTTLRIDKVEQINGKEYVYVFVVPEIRMVLLGRTGTGKSSLGNTILGRKKFKARKAAKSVTTKCGVGDRIYDNKRLLVVDTPGFFDTELSPEILIPEIAGSYQVAAPGPDVFLIVLTFDRFTPQEEAAAKWISEVFDERALDYCIIVFTGLDSLKRDEITVEEFLQDVPAFLKNLIQKCNGRYIAVDNVASDNEKEETTKLLLEKISTMVEQNGGQYYTNKHFVQIATLLDKYAGWFDPLTPDGSVNLLPEVKNIFADGFNQKHS